MKKIKIEITAGSKEILSDIFAKDLEKLKKGDKRFLSELDTEIELGKYNQTLSFGLNEVFTIMVSFASGVAVNLFSGWLQQKLQNHGVSIKIDSKRCAIEHKEINLYIETALLTKEWDDHINDFEDTNSSL